MTGERAQVLVPERVRQKPDVHDDVGVQRQSVLEAEALDGDLHLRRPDVGERRDDPLLELVDVEAGRVDHQIGGFPSRLQHRPFQLDRLEQPLGIGGQRVLAPRRVVPPDQLVGRGVEEHQGDAMAEGANRRDTL